MKLVRGRPPRRRVRLRAGPRPPPAPAEARPLWRHPLARIAVLAFGVLVVAALAADLGGAFRRSRPPADDPAALVLGIRDRVYEDPAGRFRLVLPAAWQVADGVEAAPYDAVFRGPRGLEVYVRVTPAGHERFRVLLREIRKIEREWGLNMNIRTNTFRGALCAERTVRLVEQQVRAVDFLVGRTAHHLQFAAPRDDFDRYGGLFDALLAGYEPLPAVPGPP